MYIGNLPYFIVTVVYNSIFTSLLLNNWCTNFKFSMFVVVCLCKYKTIFLINNFLILNIFIYLCHVVMKAAFF